MQGREVYKYAVNAMRKAAENVLDKSGMNVADVNKLIPHQANLRIIEAITDRMGIPSENTFVNLDKYGNCLLYTSPSPRDATLSRMPSSA